MVTDMDYKECASCGCKTYGHVMACCNNPIDKAKAGSGKVVSVGIAERRLECSHTFSDTDRCTKCGKSALSLTREQLKEAMGMLREWVDAAARVGIKSPGGMQQAKHMAVAAVAALGFVYDDTAPSDIRERIEQLWAGAKYDRLVLALRHFMAELLDEEVAVGELYRIVRSVQQTMRESPELEPHQWEPCRQLAIALAAKLCEEGTDEPFASEGLGLPGGGG